MLTSIVSIVAHWILRCDVFHKVRESKWLLSPDRFHRFLLAAISLAGLCWYRTNLPTYLNVWFLTPVDNRQPRLNSGAICENNVLNSNVVLISTGQHECVEIFVEAASEKRPRLKASVIIKMRETFHWMCGYLNRGKVGGVVWVNLYW